MEDKNSTVLISVMGCGLLALILVAAGFFLFARSSTVAVGSASGGLEVGYIIIPGALEVAKDGSQRATLRFHVTSGWTLKEFEVRDAEVRVGSDVQAAAVASTIPATPITADFDVVYQFALPAPVEGEARVPLLGISLKTRATSGGIFGGKSSGSRSLSFVIDEEAGEN